VKGALAKGFMLSDSNRFTQNDKKFDEDVTDERFSNQLFVRLVAKEIRFTNVDFKYSIFDSCYLRHCIFDSCDFIGCRFVGTNLDGSSFSGCRFDYATFEKTLVDSHILSDGCPGHENLKMRFARTLKTNYQQLGDAQSVNTAIGVELQATEAHLRKAWNSNESYYRKKYRGYKRLQMFAEWITFKSLDFLWGNGESVSKVFRAVLLAFVLVSLVDAVFFRNAKLLASYFQALLDAPQVFLGAIPSANYPRPCLICLLSLRFVVFGFITGIFVKRFNRR
jgi:hypothetical protein